MKVALIQMASDGSKTQNGAKAMSLLHKACEQNPDVICLSELFLSWGPNFAGGKDSFPQLDPYRQFARAHHVNIILGSVALESNTPNLTTNTCFIIDRQGNIAGRYDKLHMFSVNRNDFRFDERSTTIPGHSLGIAVLDNVKIGVGICFDLRFPEYFRALVKEGAQVLFLPAHFYKKTGALAWDILPSARALENQTYFCACNQTGPNACGRTKVIRYDGTVIASLLCEEDILIADLNLDAQADFRRTFPIPQL